MLGVHVCHCRQRYDYFSFWYYPIPDALVDFFCHPDNVEVHPETQGLRINGLEDRQPEQLVDIESYGPIPMFERTGIYLGPYAGEPPWITIYFKQTPLCSSDGIPYSVPEVCPRQSRY